VLRCEKKIQTQGRPIQESEHAQVIVFKGFYSNAGNPGKTSKVLIFKA
jgi:hypothetical protein